MDTHIKTVRGLKVFKKRHKVLRRLLNEANAPEIHGDKLWSSSYFLMDFLDENPPAKGSRIMEIGAGWGLLSIHCAKKYKATVTAVDADPFVMPILDLHAGENKVSVDTRVSRYEDIPARDFSRTDLLLGGDICFWDELVDPLYETICSALKAGVQRIMIGDPGRSPFLALARRCQEEMQGLLIPYVVIDPAAYDGYILVIQNHR